MWRWSSASRRTASCADAASAAPSCSSFPLPPSRSFSSPRSPGTSLGRPRMPSPPITLRRWRRRTTLTSPARAASAGTASPSARRHRRFASDSRRIFLTQLCDQWIPHHQHNMPTEKRGFVNYFFFLPFSFVVIFSFPFFN